MDEKAKIGLPKGSGKRLKVREKSGNFEIDIEWQPCQRVASSRLTAGSHCVVFLSKTIRCLVLVQPEKTGNCTDMT